MNKFPLDRGSTWWNIAIQPWCNFHFATFTKQSPWFFQQFEVWTYGDLSGYKWLVDGWLMIGWWFVGLHGDLKHHGDTRAVDDLVVLFFTSLAVGVFFSHIYPVELGYPLVILKYFFSFNMTMFLCFFPLKMVIFHSYVNVYQRVSLRWQPMGL